MTPVPAPASLAVALSMCREANTEAKLPTPMCWDLALYVERLERALGGSASAAPSAEAIALEKDAKWDGYTADEWAVRNAAFEIAANKCEQRACSSRDTGSPSAMARQCAADIRSMQRARPATQE